MATTIPNATFYTIESGEVTGRITTITSKGDRVVLDVAITLDRMSELDVDFAPTYEENMGPDLFSTGVPTGRHNITLEFTDVVFDGHIQKIDREED